MPGGAGQYRATGHGQQGNYNNNNMQFNPTIQRFGPGGPSRFDGPSEGPGSPRPPMSPGMQQQCPGSRGPNPFGPSFGYDPAKPALKKESIITNNRVELPSAAYALDSSHPTTQLPKRSGMSTAGKAIIVRVNQFKITQAPTKDIFQYDVITGKGDEKRGLVMALWNSNAVQSKLRSLIQGPWLWNGDKLAWCAFDIPEQRIMVDMDAERGRQPNAAHPNTYRVVIKRTKIIHLSVLAAFLGDKTSFNDECLESINFLDHLIRQGPSEQYTTIKRSFFNQGGRRNPLDNVVEAMRGVYSSMRLCSLNPSMGGTGTGLALNVDVANGTFWASQDVHQAARNFCKARNRGLSYQVFRDLLLPVKDHNRPGHYTYSPDFKDLRKLAKLKFRVKHRGKQDDKKDYTIKRFTFKDDAKIAREGVHAKNHFFDWKQRTGPNGSNVTTTTVSVYDYFMRKYNVRLEFWMLPLIETTREGFFPMEVCILNANQRYQYKLSPDQTATMIKFAVTRPKERLQAIKDGVGMLKWTEDRYLNYYGLKVDPNLTETKARLLPPPEVQYAGAGPQGIAKPGYSGRWDLRGKKFFLSNSEPLKSWGVCVVGECANDTTVRNFCDVFIQTYIGHGGRVQNKKPIIHIMGKNDGDLAKGVIDTRAKAGNNANSLPQILLFVLPGRDSFMYERLKKNMDCRWAMVSQMLNVAHVQKAAPQYCSNVCMKLNAKLGGTTCKVVDKAKSAWGVFPVSTMIMGADVSHAAPGSPQASMAAITMSWDKLGCRYAAACETNGHRVEMISETNIKGMFLNLFRKWMQKVGDNKRPMHIYYFRDGVSEGQYQQVLDREVKVMKNALADKMGPEAHAIKWTVTICSKRHHIRIFPKEGDSNAADKNNNALPGTLVENDVTHPYEYDFYLNAHSAIQGTARPVHYHVILDEAGCKTDAFQKLIYNSSYQYARSTTPVSLFPAVYYAHLASNRARAHEPVPSSDGPRGGQKFEERQQDASRTAAGSSQTGTTEQECLPLLALGNSEMTPDMLDGIRYGMWYI